MSSVLCLRLSHSILYSSANSLLSKSSSIYHGCYASTDSRQLRSTDLVALEYADLNLPYKDSGELGPVRVRQHVDPLSSSNIVPVQVPEWNEVYKDPILPLMVDIGCGNLSL